jgi:hypothetical protein
MIGALLIASHLCLFRPDRVIALVNLSVVLQPRDPTTKPTEKMKTVFGGRTTICADSRLFLLHWVHFTLRRASLSMPFSFSIMIMDPNLYYA